MSEDEAQTAAQTDDAASEEQPQPRDLGERKVARTHPEGEHHNTIDLARVFPFSR